MKDDSLDIINLLLDNESTDKKKDTPSRKSKSPKKEIEFSKSVESTKVIEVDDEEAVTKRSKKSLEPIFVTPEEYEKLGKPPFGYTTARINKFKKGERPPEYYNILLEYYRAAIKLCKLHKTIRWYEWLNDNDLDLCKKELEAFRVENNLTHGDMSQVIQIEYYCEYSRKKLVARLTEIARFVHVDKSISFNKFANIPSNVRPKLKYVQDVAIDETEENDEQGEESVADILQSALKLSPHACSKHEAYRGLRKPRNGCEQCQGFYDYNKSHGIKEERNND